MSALTGTLKQLSQTFSDCDLWWYLFGAQALIAYGFPRATADVDFTVPHASPNYLELSAHLIESKAG